MQVRVLSWALFILLYLFSIVGVTLFKLPDAATADHEVAQKLVEYAALAPNAPTIAIALDSYGCLAETMFTLFRIVIWDD